MYIRALLSDHLQAPRLTNCLLADSTVVNFSHTQTNVAYLLPLIYKTDSIPVRRILGNLRLMNLNLFLGIVGSCTEGRVPAEAVT